jgi:uncharacterized protein (UPF0218 family)
LFNVPRLLLTEGQRQRLKEPLGQLVAGSPSECNHALKRVQDDEKPRLLILVGDTISRNALHSGIRADVVIIDNKEMRAGAVEFPHGKTRVFKTVNAQGTIDLLAWEAVAEAVQKGNGAVLVDGEEDLLALVAIIVAPVGSIVAYGQPGEGIVIVRVTGKKKNEIQALVDGMGRAD